GLHWRRQDNRDRDEQRIFGSERRPRSEVDAGSGKKTTSEKKHVQLIAKARAKKAIRRRIGVYIDAPRAGRGSETRRNLGGSRAAPPFGLGGGWGILYGERRTLWNSIGGCLLRASEARRRWLRCRMRLGRRRWSITCRTCSRKR